MASAQAVLDIARSQLGVHEDPPGSNQVLYATWAGIPGLAWCAAFFCWVLDQAGALDVPRFVNCAAGLQAYSDRGRAGSEPRIGAAVFFQWPGWTRACHIGVVEAIRPDGEVTIEGNTDAAGGRTGGKVMRQVRRANIVGYGYPVYDELAPATPIAPAVPVTIAARPMVRQGSRGPAVAELQQKLNAMAGGAGLATDGIFGPRTAEAVRGFQRFHGLAVDGIVGPRTWGALG